MLICKKTGNIPVFGFKCNNYPIDEAEYKNIEDKLLWAIEKKIDRGDFMVGINRKTELFKHKKCQDYMRLP